MSMGVDRNSRLITHKKKENMCEFVAVLLASCSVLFGLTACTTSFDQRQTGDLNVQIGLKNIQLIALLHGGSEEYVDYDYAYDYSEMTIKPQNGTTSKPSNVTHSQSNTNLSTTPLPFTTESNVTNIGIDINDTIHAYNHQFNATASIFNEKKPDHVTNTTELLNVVNESTNNTTGYGNTVTENSVILLQTAIMAAANYTQHRTSTSNIGSDLPTTISAVFNDASEPTPLQTKHCRRGFVRNNQGKCEYKIHGPSNALRRIVKLAQKIKIGRGIKET